MNRQKNFFHIALMALASMLGVKAQASPATPPAGSIYVSTTGSNANDGLTAGTAVKSIHVALQKAFESRLPADTNLQTAGTQIPSADHPNIWTLFKGACAWADNVTIPASPAPGSTGKVAFITLTANLNSREIDRAIALHLEDLGYDVTIVPRIRVTQQSFSIAEANTFNLIVFGESCSGADSNGLRDATMTTPMINTEGFSWDDWGYISTGTGILPSNAGTQTPGPNITILNNTTMQTGLAPGVVPLYSRPYIIGVGDVNGQGPVFNPSGGINVVATCDNLITPAFPGQCIFTVEAGAALATPTTTPAGIGILANSPGRVVCFGLFASGAFYDDNVTQADGTTIVNAFDNPTPANIVVAGGTYATTYPIGLMRNLTIQGGWNATFDDQTSTRTTVIDAQSRGRIIYANNGNPQNEAGTAGNSTADTGVNVNLADNSRVDSLTLKNGNITRPATATGASTGNTTIYRGAGIYSEGNPQGVNFTNCTIDSCTALLQGGAIVDAVTYVAPTTGSFTGFSYNLKFSGCSFTNNTTLTENGSVVSTVTAGPSLVFDRCLFSGNTCPSTAAGFGSGMIYINSGATPNFVLSNSIIKGNSVSGPATTSRLIFMNGAATAGQQLTIKNNTFYGNSVVQHVIFDNGAATNFDDIANNIFVNNTGTGNTFARASVSASPGVSTARNNLKFNNTGLTDGLIVTGSNGNISTDPLFVNAAGGDFHVPAISPAVNAGANTGSGFDFDGRSRPQQGIMDIGAFEFPASATNAVSHWTIF